MSSIDHLAAGFAANVSTDQKLLKAVQAGDEPALRELLERHAPSVFRFAMKMCRHRDDAEDVAQETLLAAVRGAKDVRETTSFATWLYAVARNFCIKMRRRQKLQPSRDASTDDASMDPASEHGAPDEDASAHELAVALDRAVGKLDDKYREVIVLRDIEGLSAAEVAEVLGITVEAVKSRLHRARSDVRANLGRFEPVPDSPAVPRDAPCAEIGTTFSRYLEGEIGPAACAAMQRHVEGCTSCSSVCEGLRRSVALCRQARTSPIPDDVQVKVRRAIENALREAHRAHRRRANS
jgi:RNA polymerase sigma-70 factor, ECF subfamily